MGLPRNRAFSGSYLMELRDWTAVENEQRKGVRFPSSHGEKRMNGWLMKANKYFGKYSGTLGTSSLDRIRGAELLRSVRKFPSSMRLCYLLHSSKSSEHSSP